MAGSGEGSRTPKHRPEQRPPSHSYWTARQMLRQTIISYLVAAIDAYQCDLSKAALCKPATRRSLGELLLRFNEHFRSDYTDDAVAV
jgi:hypothetical protein